ncbi:MAG: thiamine-phosphate kinase [Gammaproteobacteria bacterium]|nr:thiamine-phosphate kinase [Gammaproteobacteria bacterium]
MDEFELIEHFFNVQQVKRPEVQLGIGDDCSVLSIPPDMDLLVSTDTLVSGVHFLPDWDPGDIAYKAVMVNISDCIAMGGKPFAITLALTLTDHSTPWLSAFSQGLHEALHRYDIALVGGDTTRGPLSITITIHGLVPKGRAVTRAHAQVGDRIYVSGYLGLAAFAVAAFETPATKSQFEASDYVRYTRAELLSTAEEQLSDHALMKRHLHYPLPRTDWRDILSRFATSAIDISDGLSIDLSHLCTQSKLGAHLRLIDIPVHPLLAQYTPKGLQYALEGGDDYELCFTIPAQKEQDFLEVVRLEQMNCYCIGVMEKEAGIRATDLQGNEVELTPRGYQHFFSAG